MLSYKLLDNVTDTIGKYYGVLPTILLIAYGLIFMGVIYINSEYLYMFKTMMQVLVCIFLIYRFHPYRNHVLQKYDANIIFSSAIFLLVNISAVAVANQIITPIDDTITIMSDLPLEELVNVAEVM
tara:strand:- start:1418 stop:1795 length:378 start_codon:yes stop_codon:yes gene_type:complete